MTVLSVTGLYSLWKLTEASAVPLGTVVWAFPTVNLLGGILVLVGAFRELDRNRVGDVPTMT